MTFAAACGPVSGLELFGELTCATRDVMVNPAAPPEQEFLMGVDEELLEYLARWISALRVESALRDTGLSGGQADSINEGLSDVSGKFIGITSNDPNDTGANRWLLGAGSSLGAIRNMRDPRSSRKPQPDRVNGPGWQTGNPDVHINDGVVNKADYLITDGDTFNGQTVRGLGLDKSVQIWWGVENTLTQSATFKDVGDALNSSCAALAKAGTAGITADDCVQVGNAVKATQLDQDPS